ncbi:hypothetical protein [Longispora albida]|uniref:hypothetical protein n=1 Tax=Longispora albida TaxID=203523 RepID=UPI00035EB28E|nr:hypothetical protein [Longispora albida]
MPGFPVSPEGTLLNSTPAQREELGAKIVSFMEFYAPDCDGPLIYRDRNGRYGFGPGPGAPGGCTVIVTRTGLERLMLHHGYLSDDLHDPGVLDAFAELVIDHARPA